MKDQTHLTKRGAIYWFRCRVPLDLIEHYGKSDIRFSLKTKDRKKAIEEAQTKSSHFTQEFHHLRRLRDSEPLQKLTQVEIERLALLWASEVMAADEQRRVDKTLSDSYRAGIDQGLDYFRDALAQSDYSATDSFLPLFLEGRGIKLKADSDSYRSLAYAVLKEGVRVYLMLWQRECGEPVDTPKAEEVIIRTDIPSPKEDTLEALRDYWKTQPAKKGGEKGRTSIAEANTMIRKFKEMVGDIPASKIERKHVVLLKDKMIEAGDAPATINKGRGMLAAVFSCAFENEKIKVNPFYGMKKLPIPEREEDKPYTIDELQTIFKSPVFSQGERPRDGGGEAAFWMPLLGLYTGARLNEAGQLFTEDVGEEDGIPFILIKPDSATGRTTKDKKRRRVPIHPDLVAMGFLEYVERMRKEGHVQLFPLLKVTRKGGKLAQKWGSWWSSYVRVKLGITRVPKPFHGMRDSFTEYGRKVGMDREHRMRIEGHSLNTVGDTEYGNILFPLEPLYEAIKGLRFKGLNLGHLMREVPQT